MQLRQIPDFGWRFIVWLVLGLNPIPACWAAEPQKQPAELGSWTHRLYCHLLQPQEHPDYERRAVKPPTWKTFQHRTQFTCLRGFDVQDEQIVGFRQEIEKFTTTHDLGEVIWPSYPILFTKNLAELATEIKRRNLYLFDVWGYVPGSGPGGYWQQFQPPTQAFNTLEAILGDRWLGTDIGEQDGRYIGGYADQLTPASANRFEQYLNFQRHFERMSDDLGNKHAALVSLNFGHYLLKEGTFTLLGAETAQALPNNQVYYAFIRGAGKQYGVPWFGNASVYNRWGYKNYGSEATDHGPTKGSSLSLMRRLLFSHILYNCFAVGFENGWFEGDKLSPIGQVQESARKWVKTNGQPGVMLTPVALLLDFNAGWTFPRHLYTSHAYRVWGNLPYEAGDYLTDAVLDLLYPGYQNSSYFHDERGFITATPYGDIADCILSDAPLWLLNRYAVVIVAGGLSGGKELAAKLQAFAQNGGHLVLTAANLGTLPGGVAGMSNVVRNTTVVCGRGRVTCFASPYGLRLNSVPSRSLRSQVDKPLARPYTLEPSFEKGLRHILQEQVLFLAKGQDLSTITCRKAAGEYTIGVANNGWRERPFKLESHCGSIKSIRELALDQSAKTAVGYVPEGTVAALGQSDEGTIAGGDVRIFSVRVEERNLEEIPHSTPPPRPHNRILPLRDLRSIREEILARPTFFQHFDGICVDWRYLHRREQRALQSEAAWLKRQNVRIFADLSSGIDLYPTLRLIDNVPADYQSSMAVIGDVLKKLELLGGRDLILSLHRFPENNFTDEQSRAAFTVTLRALAAQAAQHGITLHLRLAFGKPPWSLSEGLDWIEHVNTPNLRLAPSTALLPVKPLSAETRARLKKVLGLWFLAGVRRDAAGELWDAHAPIHDQLSRDILQLLALSPSIPLVLDALYSDQDQEYTDVDALAKALGQ